jgi:hypothetical protein
VARRNRYYNGEISDHFDGSRFFPPVEVPDKTPADLARMLLSKNRRPWPATNASPNHDRPPARVDALRLSFIGHSSILLQVAGLNLLIDPVWSERVSPVSFAGPRRANPPASPSMTCLRSMPC